MDDDWWEERGLGEVKLFKHLRSGWVRLELRGDVFEPAGHSRGHGHLHQVRTHGLEVEEPEDEREVPV